MKMLMTHLFEAFRQRLYDFAFEEPTISAERGGVEDLMNQAYMGSSVIFTFLSFLHQSQMHKGFKKHLASPDCNFVVRCGVPMLTLAEKSIGQREIRSEERKLESSKSDYEAGNSMEIKKSNYN